MKKILKKYKISVGCSTQNLEIIRNFVLNIAHQNHLDADQISQIELAVDEASTNVIKHSCEYNEAKTLTIEIKIEEDRFIVEIIDRGDKKFDPNSVQKVNLKEFVKNRKHGGLGIHLMKNLMDDVQYYGGDKNYNRVKLIKNI